FDYENDLAVLRPAFQWPGGRAYPVAKFAAAEPAVGDPVAAVGYPLNSSLKARYISPGTYTGPKPGLGLLRETVDTSLPWEQNIVAEPSLPGTFKPLQPGERMAVQFGADGKVQQMVPDAQGQYIVKKGTESSLDMHVEPGNSGSPLLNMQ